MLICIQTQAASKDSLWLTRIIISIIWMSIKFLSFYAQKYYFIHKGSEWGGMRRNEGEMRRNEGERGGNKVIARFLACHYPTWSGNLSKLIQPRRLRAATQCYGRASHFSQWHCFPSSLALRHHEARQRPTMSSHALPKGKRVKRSSN